MNLPILTGEVVRGDGRGAQLGFPTANIKVSSGTPPALGVYKVRVSGGGLTDRLAVCNVGRRPTIEGSAGVHVEAHVPGWRGDLYGRILTVTFVSKIRDERKFPSLDALKSQIAEDVLSIGRP